MNLTKTVATFFLLVAFSMKPVFAQNTDSFSIQKIDGRYFQIIDDMRIEVEGVGPLSVLRKDVRKWPDGILPILFEEGYDEAEKQKFFDGCALWSTYSKVKCVDHNEYHNDYIIVVASDDENSSAVG